MTLGNRKMREYRQNTFIAHENTKNIHNSDVFTHFKENKHSVAFFTLAPLSNQTRKLYV